MGSMTGLRTEADLFEIIRQQAEQIEELITENAQLWALRSLNARGTNTSRRTAGGRARLLRNLQDAVLAKDRSATSVLLLQSRRTSPWTFLC